MKQHQRCAVGCLAGLVWVTCSFGVELPVRFERFGPEQGLPHNTVTSIIQDDLGYLWIGTDDGLGRYDGGELEIFRFDPERTAMGASNAIQAVLEDSKRRLWVGTSRGLYLFDRTTQEFKPYLLRGPLPTEERYVTGLLEDVMGRIWVAVEGGVFVYGSEMNDFTTVGVGELPEGAFVSGIDDDPQGNIWVMVSDRDRAKAALHRIAGGDQRVDTYPVRGTGLQYRFFIDSSARLWMDSRCDLPIQRAELPDLPEPATSFFEATDGTMWIGTSTGLVRYDAGRREVLHLADDGSWQANHVNALCEDSSGGLWVGTLGGLFHYNPVGSAFAHLRHMPNDPGSLSADPVSAIAEDPVGGIWIGSFGGGLNYLDHQTRKVRRYRHDPEDPQSLCNDRVWALCSARDGTLWVGTEGGLCRRKSGTDFFSSVPMPFPDNVEQRFRRVKIVTEHVDGSLWLGTNFGLFRYFPDSDVFRWYGVTGDGRGLSFPEVGSLFVADEGTVWIGTTDGGLNRFDVKQKRFDHHQISTSDGREVNSVPVYDIQPNGSQGLWLATNLGLCRFSFDRGVFEYPLAAGELPGSVVFSLLEDAAGRLWLGTNQGLVRFDPSLNGEARLRTYGSDDGVGSLEFNRHATLRSSSGEFFFGGMAGLTIFRPDQVRASLAEPAVVLTRIRTVGAEGERQIIPYGLPGLVLSHRERSVSFEFAAVSLSDAGKNQYQHRLLGFEQRWIDAGRRRFARYTHIPPGEYTLEVRAANRDGIWSTAKALLPVTVLPPWWSTWWFRLFMVCLGVAGLTTAYRIRVARLLEIERMRLRIAGDLHDELGSELSGIALAAAMIGRRQTLETHDLGRLEQIQATALEVMHGLRDIVWYVNPEHDGLESTVSRMRSFSSAILEGVDHEFIAEVDHDIPLGMAQRRDLFLIFKELVHNTVRHARASVVTVRLEHDDEMLRLAIADDGIGFDPTIESDGSGLGSVCRRAEQIGGRLNIDSAPGRGTRITVEIGTGKRFRKGRGAAGVEK